MSSLWLTHISVSYTHLDVYKRQGRDELKTRVDETAERIDKEFDKLNKKLRKTEGNFWVKIIKKGLG